MCNISQKLKEMCPKLLMAKFATLLEGDKTELNEQELNQLSELHIYPLLDKECISSSKDTRVYQVWMFKQIDKDGFVEDLSFVAASLAANGIKDAVIHEFVEYVLAPKLEVFVGNPDKLREEIVEKVFASEEVVSKK